MDNLFENESEQRVHQLNEVFLERYEINKETIMKDFKYETLVGLSKILKNNFIEIRSTRLDLDAKKEPLKKHNNEIGIFRYGVFHNRKEIDRKHKETELIADLIIANLKLKEAQLQKDQTYFETEKEEVLFWGNYHKDVWKMVYSEGVWYLYKLYNKPYPNVIWGD